MQNTINGNFVGRLTIFGFDCFFALLDGYDLKIVPKTEDIELFNATCKEREYNFDSLGWIKAVDERGYDVAFLLSDRQGFMCYRENMLALTTDIILQTTNVRDSDGQYLYDYKDLEGFTAIDFTGDAVNAIFSPKIAIQKYDFSNNHIELLPVKEYAKNFSTELNGVKCNLIFTVIVDRASFFDSNTEFGKLHSVLRLEFNERQDLSMIENCWQGVCTLLAFCLGRYNVTDINIGLWDTKGKIGTTNFESLIHCKMNNDKIEGGEYKYLNHYHFQVEYLGEKIGSLFHLLNNEKTKPILSFMPRTNIDNNVDQSKIRDLCTALEVEYDYHNENEFDSALSQLVDELKVVVKNYKEKNPEMIETSTYDYIIGSLNHISLPARNKLWYVYSRYAPIIDERINRGIMLHIKCDEVQTKKDIGWFVKLRNNITHSAGFMETEIPNAIYSRLKIAVYCSVLERAAYSMQDISNIIKKYFGK